MLKVFFSNDSARERIAEKRKKSPFRLFEVEITGIEREKNGVGLGWGFVFGSISFFAPSSSSSIEESGRFLALLVTRSI